jgi:transposase
MFSTQDVIGSDILDHLGLVAAIIDKLGIAKQIDKLLPLNYGQAKNKRVDLKQMTLLLATTEAAGFPVWMESHSGNAVKHAYAQK